MTREELESKVLKVIEHDTLEENTAVQLIMNDVDDYTQDLETELADFANDVMDQFGYNGQSGGLSTLEWAESIIKLAELSSKELETELRQLSGWKGDFTLGYLLRKLPSDVTVKLYVDTVTGTSKRVYYFVGNFDKRLTDRFDTPEDAACKLHIELIKEGVVTPELSSKEKEGK